MNSLTSNFRLRFLQFIFMARRSESRARNWVFTVNNYIDEDIDMVKRLSEDTRVQRIICEKEVGSEGTPHLQGYVSFETEQARSTVEKWLGGRAWLKKAYGGYRQNYDYCTKEGKDAIIVSKGFTRSECENLRKQTFRDMINDAKVLDPMTFEDKYPEVWFNHRNKVLNTMLDAALARVSNWNGDLKMKNYWIWGKAGIGKSRWAAQRMEPKFQYKKAVNKWWDGYNIVMHKLVMLEDFPKQGQMFAQHLKIWCDRYFFMAECKGSSLCIEPGRFFFIVTSNFPIDACFDDDEDANAIHRRFTEFEVTNETLCFLNSMNLDTSILKN